MSKLNKGASSFERGASNRTAFRKKSHIRLEREASKESALRERLKKNPRKWMGALQDDLSIAQISIPGTHESAALHGMPIMPNLSVPKFHINPATLGVCKILRYKIN